MDKTGEKVTQWIDDETLVILNDGSPTGINPNTGNTTMVDVTIVPATILISSDWVVVQDPCGLDHLPVITTLSQAQYKKKKQQHSQSPESTPKSICPNLQTY
jgi:hypothetical protein